MKNYVKLIALLSVVALIFAGWQFDKVRAVKYDLQIVSVSPNPGIADGQTPVTIHIRVTKSGKACVGHTILARSESGGSFKAKRTVTDESGVAEIVYYPYVKSKLNELTDVTLRFNDESNSVFISVPASLVYVLPMSAPGSENGGQATNEGMFG